MVWGIYDCIEDWATTTYTRVYSDDEGDNDNFYDNVSYHFSYESTPHTLKRTIIDRFISFMLIESVNLFNSVFLLHLNYLFHR